MILSCSDGQSECGSRDGSVEDDIPPANRRGDRFTGSQNDRIIDGLNILAVVGDSAVQREGIAGNGESVGIRIKCDPCDGKCTRSQVVVQSRDGAVGESPGIASNGDCVVGPVCGRIEIARSGSGTPCVGHRFGRGTEQSRHSEEQ